MDASGHKKVRVLLRDDREARIGQQVLVDVVQLGDDNQ
jgi:hypothetical protein